MVSCRPQPPYLGRGHVSADGADGLVEGRGCPVDALWTVPRFVPRSPNCRVARPCAGRPALFPPFRGERAFYFSTWDCGGEVVRQGRPGPETASGAARPIPNARLRRHPRDSVPTHAAPPDHAPPPRFLSPPRGSARPRGWARLTRRRARPPKAPAALSPGAGPPVAVAALACGAAATATGGPAPGDKAAGAFGGRARRRVRRAQPRGRAEPRGGERNRGGGAWSGGAAWVGTESRGWRRSRAFGMGRAAPDAVSGPGRPCRTTSPPQSQVLK